MLTQKKDGAYKLRPLGYISMEVYMEFYKTYEDSPYVAKNVFLQMEPEDAPLPTYDQVKNALPKPVWDGHSDAVSCYDYAWQIAFKNLQKANKTNHFVSNYIDTAFDMPPKVRQPFGVHILFIVDRTAPPASYA